MKEKDEIAGLFRSRLSNTEMTVREGFWDKLEKDLLKAAVSGKEDTSEPLILPPFIEIKKRIPLSPRFYRVAAAVSVVIVLGAASAAFWYFSPKEEIQKAFTQAAALTPEGNLNGDVVQESFPSIHKTNPTASKIQPKQSANGTPVGLAADTDDESVSLHVSITITQRVYNNSQQGNAFQNHNNTQNGNYSVERENTNTNSNIKSPFLSDDEITVSSVESVPKPRNWAIKAAVGTSLPKGDMNMPFTAGLTLEHSLNQILSLETGIQYNCLFAASKIQTLSIPVKLNLMLASISRFDLYATVGGAVEKCIAGASDNSFKAEPVQLSVGAGVGLRYKMNDRFALFAEPSVSHHFDTSSKTRTLRTERPTNLNLLCGVRMTY